MSKNKYSKKFSKTHKTYSDWVYKTPQSSYKQRIVRLHGMYPTGSLSQLRGHPKRHERGLRSIAKTPLHKRVFSDLSSQEISKQQTALSVLSEVRRGKGSLTKISRKHHITPKTVRKYTNAFRKSGNRWNAKKYDRLGRPLKINENGREISIIVNDSRYSSIIGRYHSAIKRFLETGNESLLTPFRNKRIKDSDGNWHTLETDPDKIYDIQDMREDEEFYTIYN